MINNLVLPALLFVFSLYVYKIQERKYDGLKLLRARRYALSMAGCFLMILIYVMNSGEYRFFLFAAGLFGLVAFVYAILIRITSSSDVDR